MIKYLKTENSISSRKPNPIKIQKKALTRSENANKMRDIKDLIEYSRFFKRKQIIRYVYKKKKNENNIPIKIKDKTHSVFGSFSWHLKDVKE